MGFDTSDDAAVYKISEDTAIVTTADFITPPVDDPYQYGQIAAANAISDIYAMGGRPVTCLNLVAFPLKKLGPDVLQKIVAGAVQKISEAGAVLAGGHSVEDDEPKFGLAVTGLVHPEKYWSNVGATPGDVLILTKPIGSGVLFNANLKGWVSDGAMQSCLETIAALNKTAAEVLRAHAPNAVTDVTGFGVASHAFEMAKGSGAQLNIDLDALPIMAESLEMYKRGMTTGSNDFNRRLVSASSVFKRNLPAWHEQIVFDPQTSGGLLAAVPESSAPSAIEALHRAGIPNARIIGRVAPLTDALHLVFR